MRLLAFIIGGILLAVWAAIGLVVTLRRQMRDDYREPQPAEEEVKDGSEEHTV